MFNSTTFFSSQDIATSRPRPDRDQWPKPYDLTRPMGGLEIRRILLGYIIPPITIVVVCVYIFMIIVFCKGRFTSSAHVILVAIAIADMVDGVSISIPAIYFFTFGMYKRYISYQICPAYITLDNILPYIAHCVSVTMTVALDIQRLIVVRFPFKAKTICSRRNTLITILLAVCYSILANVPQFYKFSQIEGRYIKSKTDPSKNVYACMRNRSAIPFETTTMLRITMVMFIPISVLIITSILLIRELSKISKNVKKLNCSTEQILVLPRLRQNRTITLLTALVALSVLVADVPGISIYFTLTYVNSKIFHCRLCANLTFQAIFRVVIQLLYPSNFLCYCFISGKFRKTVVDVLKCRSSHLKEASANLTPKQSTSDSTKL